MRSLGKIELDGKVVVTTHSVNKLRSISPNLSTKEAAAQILLDATGTLYLNKVKQEEGGVFVTVKPNGKHYSMVIWIDGGAATVVTVFANRRKAQAEKKVQD
jgi:hypothetical protein